MLIKVHTLRFGLFALIGVISRHLSAGDSPKRCIEEEKQSLLKLKEGFTGGSDIFSSWKDDLDCCTWKGISCNNLTGHVISLDLQFLSSSEPFADKIKTSLCELSRLTYLDLSHNNFGGQRIPKCIGSLGQLKELKLADAGLAGNIPHELQNLSNLQTLDLDLNPGLTAQNLNWVSHLSSLRYLDLSTIDLSQAIDWLSSISKVTSLVELRLIDCGIPNVNHILSSTHMNVSTTLEYLDLTGNKLNSPFPMWVFNVSKVLIHLDLSDSSLKGLIPDTFENMIFIEYLDLSVNNFEGGIPKSFRHMCNLERLYLYSNHLSNALNDSIKNLCLAQNNIRTIDLRDNPFMSGPFPELTRFSSLERLNLQKTSLNGSFPESFGHLPHLWTLDLSYNNLSGSLSEFRELPSLKFLDLSHNKLSGIHEHTLRELPSLFELYLASNKIEAEIREEHVSNLSSLGFLDISHNFISLKFHSNWIPPFQLFRLSTSSCILGPLFPIWLQNQRVLRLLDISNTGISDSAPEWFWDMSSTVLFLNISHNNIQGALPKSLPKLKPEPFHDIWTVYTRILDLSFNNLSGPLPFLQKNFSILVLSRNKLSGSLSSLCRTSQPKLYYLDISDNLLSGTIPDCWEKFQELRILNFASNNLSGKLPRSFGSLNQIMTIHLSNNNLSGELPSLMNCRMLQSIDFGDNNLEGKLPTWIGHNLPRLIVLRLRSNKFLGTIPLSLCNLTSLQILDLSQNSFTGEIPSCFNNLSALLYMKSSKDIISYQTYGFQFSVENMDLSFVDNAILMWKGRDYEYKKNLRFFTSIDLSCNYLNGEIPRTIACLAGLASLNLSRNNLNGSIPDSLGHMKLLESLDLSRNGLSGRIPESMSNLSFLAYLNLSFNHLSGLIPPSSQLQTFDVTTYMGNYGLCGPPLNKECLDESSRDPTLAKGRNESEDDGDGLISFGFYICMGFGFILAFLGVSGTLIFKSL